MGLTTTIYDVNMTANDYSEITTQPLNGLNNVTAFCFSTVYGDNYSTNFIWTVGIGQFDYCTRTFSPNLAFFKFSQSIRKSGYRSNIRSFSVDIEVLSFTLPTLKTVNAPKEDRFRKNVEIAFNDEKYSDFTVKAGDQSFKVSKFLLRTQSEYFDKMFNHPMKEGLSNEMEIKETDPEMVKLMLMFLYSGKVENLESVAEKLFPLAVQYQIEDLVDMCVNSMGSSLNLANIIDRLHLSAYYDHLTDFKDKVLDFAKTRYAKIKQLDGWKAFTRENGEMIAELLDKIMSVW